MERGPSPTPDPDALRRLTALLDEARYAQVETHATELLHQFPDLGPAWKALGIARFMLGRDALAVLHQATLRLADDHDAHFNLGLALRQAGQAGQALASFGRALAIAPGDADSLDQVAAILIGLGRFAEAAACYRALLAIAPDSAALRLNLGNVLKRLGQRDEAEACYRRAIELEPGFADAHYNLGVVLGESARHAAAADSCRRALAIAPDYAPAHLNLGNALKRLGQPADAAQSYRAALALRPDFAEAHLDLGNLLDELGLADQAIGCYRRAIESQPAFAEVHLNLGNTLKGLGRFDDAVASYRRAIAIAPDFFAAHDNLLFTHNLIAGQDPATMIADARHFGERARMAARPRTHWPNLANSPQARRRLRVGLVSGDFRDHPVAYFLESVLAALRATADLELFAYSNCRRGDALTLRIATQCHAWRPIADLTDAQAAQQIADDAIDILIDLAGHTEHNRLPLFAWRAAPVQVSWLGYHATSGLAEIDHIVADRWTVLPTEEAWFTEKVWRLPETLWCLTPPGPAPEVSALPALANGYLTFTCCNRLDKMGEPVVALWARVLRSVSGSRLLLKAGLLAHDAARARVAQRFARHGIDASRLILEGASSRADYLATYRRVDIALDPFPYAGATTSVEALWMGVPILTLAGERFMSRQGVSLLSNAGLADWIAADLDDYVARAMARAGDLQGLSALRASLRDRVLASPLCDAPRFALIFEAALRAMWQQRCAGQQRRN